MTNTNCDECGKETSETFPLTGQNLCRECFDAAQADAENYSVSDDLSNTVKK